MNTERVSGKTAFTAVSAFAAALLLIALLIGGLAALPARAAGALSIEVIAGPNFVVDSNVSAPSTYAPSVATIIVKYTNTGDQPLTDVYGYIGNYATTTPGVYPVRDSDDAGFIAEHPHLANSGDYSFTHIGGRVGLDDATRYMGTLLPGETRVQYWHFTYPRCEGSIEPPCGANEPVWGTTHDPNDDLWLEYDVWGTGFDEPTGAAVGDNATTRATMRNEISAMANKIEPHNGRWFNTDTDTVRPGDTITSNGVRYDLGNVRHGFDNDGDLVPDFNAWLQPIGNPNYDPSCFRLIRTTGLLTISRGAGQPTSIVEFTDQLYFSNLPPDNTGVIGNVHYTFLALDGPCNTALTPYQEVASGFDNEKFNADYGAGIPPVVSLEPEVEIDKAGNLTVIAGGTINYSMDVDNTGTDGAGLPLYSVPLVVSDAIPADTTYASGTASGTNVEIRYSIDGGQTWTTTEPSPASGVTHIQWWFTDTLAGGDSRTITFDVDVSGSPSSPFIENCADVRFDGAAAFDEDCHVTMVQGTNQIGDLVWRDEDFDGVQDAGEPGIPGITVSLYWDRNGNGVLDSGEMLIATDVTDGSGTYSFDNLPDGDFIVVVDDTDADLPTGYNLTTAGEYAVTGLGTTITSPYLDADFGFGPVLSLEKTLTSGAPAYEGDTVTYNIELINTRPGDGTGQGTPCEHPIWAGHVNGSADVPASGTGNREWVSTGNALYSTDGVYAVANLGNNPQELGLGDFSVGPQAGTIISVELVLYLQEQDVELQAGDNLEVDVYIDDSDADGSSSVPLIQYTGAADFTGAVGDTYVFREDLSTLLPAVTWDWSHFLGDRTELFLVGDKGPGNSPGDIALDGVAFIIHTDQTCGGPSDAIAVLPLMDDYDADLLQFVSATPAESSVSTGGGSPYANTGTITWDDLGPLYAGETKTVVVTFLALEPPDNDSDGENDQATITNTAYVQSATYYNGNPVNDASDDAVGELLPTGEIGDLVWNDVNGDGSPTGEDGISGVTVDLYWWNGATWVLSDTQVTDVAGNYLFEGVRDGTYEVRVDESTLPGTTYTRTGDPDATLDGVGTATINNNNGSSTDDDNLDMDFGYQIPNTIYGNVWEDNNGDATQDAGENGINGVTVNLYRYNGATWVLEDTVTTDANGDYSFSDLSDGDYYVAVDSTAAPLGGDWSNTVDPEGAPGDDEMDPISISGGNIYGSYDFGYYQTGALSIGDTLYVDWNGDGDQDSGEEGIPNITIFLYEDSNGDGVTDPATDALITTDVTGGNGNYGFSGLPAGDYIVVVDEDDADWPAGTYVQTEDYDGTPDGQAEVTLTVSNIDTVDFGYQPVGSGSIGDLVWEDTDADGIYDAGEPGIPNITVDLYEDGNNNGVIDGGDALVATTTTDGSGNYSFTGLPAGDYLVDVDTADTDLPDDGDGNPYVLSTNNDPHDVALSAGQAYVLADFGFTTGGVIGDFIWQDNNGDGAQDAGEPGIANVTVELYTDPNGDGDPADGSLIDTTTTDASGIYIFTGVPAGTYVVEVDITDSDLPCTDGSCMTYDPDLASDGQAAVDLPAGATYLGADWGFEPLGNIGDTLWIDVDRNGARDAGESGIAYITVDLYADDGSGNPTGPVLQTTETDSDGYYSFGGVSDDDYVVVVNTADPDFPVGLSQTYDPDGTCPGITCNSQALVTISGGNSDWTIDFGYDYPDGNYSISGNTFYDNNDNGNTTPNPDGGDTPYPDVTVYLWLDTGGGDYTLIDSTTSDASGNYSFTDLSAGTYRVSTSSVAPDGEDITTASQHTVTLGPSSTGNDFGFYGTAYPMAVILRALVARGGYATVLAAVLGLSVALGGVVLLRRRRR